MSKPRAIHLLMLAIIKSSHPFQYRIPHARSALVGTCWRTLDPRRSLFRHSTTLASLDTTDERHSNDESTDAVSQNRLTGAERGAAKEAARQRRKKLLGVAKAVDRGLPNVMTYKPAERVNDQMVTFEAKSGLPDRSKLFTVLGIESSCDDTGAAVVRSDGTILGESLAKQYEIHEVWGGVVPGLARDAHVEAIDRVVASALQTAGLTSVDQVDAIAVTIGPGLEICLRVGCEKAVALAEQYRKPFIGVHHLEAHILMARLPLDTAPSVSLPATTHVHETKRTVDFPFLALLVSGGHCQILQCHGIGQYEILGGTLDDSLGEAYDKTARLLGLPVGGGGGPAVEQLARLGDAHAIALSVPMQSRKDCDFSYAGLKTNVRRAGEQLVAQYNQRALDTTNDTAVIVTADQLPEQDKANIAASFQHVAIRHVEDRLNRAMSLMEESSNIRTLAVVGGVAANQELRLRLEALCNKRKEPWTMLVPPPRLCTDQGAMSAWAGVERLMVGSTDTISSQVYARYPFAQSTQ